MTKMSNSLLLIVMRELLSTQQGVNAGATRQGLIDPAGIDPQFC
jgi:hypothetical protein